MSEKSISCLFWNIRANKQDTINKIFEFANPDILFLAEVETPNLGTICSLLNDRGYECIKWVGDDKSPKKGLALYAKSGIIDNSYTAGDGDYCIAAKLSGGEECVVGVWTKTEKPIRYCDHMQNIFDYHIAKENNPIFIGDFNVSSKVIGSSGRAAIRLFKYFKEKGYESLYHLDRSIEVGEEIDVTHLHSSGGYFMVDYVLIPVSSSGSIDLITDYSSAKDFLQSGYSDHIPIIFELKNRNEKTS